MSAAVKTEWYITGEEVVTFAIAHGDVPVSSMLCRPADIAKVGSRAGSMRATMAK